MREGNDCSTHIDLILNRFRRQSSHVPKTFRCFLALPFPCQPHSEEKPPGTLKQSNEYADYFFFSRLVFFPISANRLQAERHECTQHHHIHKQNMESLRSSNNRNRSRLRQIACEMTRSLASFQAMYAYSVYQCVCARARFSLV